MAREEPLAIKIRNGLFNAPSRTTGEQLLEPLIRQRFDLLLPEGNDHDAIDKQGRKYEIKTSKVLRKPPHRASGNLSYTILQRVLDASQGDSKPTERMISFSECKHAEYDANIQNVKRDHFDELLYVLLFGDCVKIFALEKAKIQTGLLPGWSDRHGRYDAVGKSGQFNVTRRTIQWHLDNCLRDTMNYEEMATIYINLSAHASP